MPGGKLSSKLSGVSYPGIIMRPMTLAATSLGNVKAPIRGEISKTSMKKVQLGCAKRFTPCTQGPSKKEELLEHCGYYSSHRDVTF